MYRYLSDELNLNIIFDNGGLGDSIARLPAIKYILDKHEHIIVHLWIPDYFYEIAANCLEHDNLHIYRFSQAQGLFNSQYPSRAFSYVPHSNLASHLTDHSFRILCNTDVEDRYKNYLTINTDSTNISSFKLPENYFVMTTGFTANVRHFKSEYINTITKHVKMKYGLEPVFLGKSETNTGSIHVIKGLFDEDLDLSIGINLIDKTSLLESSKILKHSKFVVGLDNGLMHLAGASGNVPIVGGFTTVDPKFRLPYRQDILGFNCYAVSPLDIECTYCQSNMTFTFNHDFKECFYDDVQCCENLTPDKWLYKIDEVMRDLNKGTIYVG